MTLVRPGHSASSSPTTVDPASMNKLVDEIDENSFYHHPSWPQRWSHPDFTGDYTKAWSASWRRQAEGQTTRFLSPSMEYKFPWGYIIYRTVYTPKSDELWPIAMEKLGHIINSSIDAGLHAKIRHNRPEDPESNEEPERLVKESRKDVIFSDKRFWDRAGIEQIRQHFREYLRASKGTIYGRFKGCLVIDELSLKSIVFSDVPQPWLGGRSPNMGQYCLGVVGMIDGLYPESRDHPRYTGFMRVYVRSLWDLYCQLCRENMRESIPYPYLFSVPEGLIPVYDGGTGEAQDEEGNIYPIVLERPKRGPRVA
ncbi:uncharacterized protein N7482_000244 [Penicillium canariense]|uniref:Uncharacterized protein n=1 Tax=Penicillium canariense TaxID=189055 RepID=A0A9W9IDE4_9EURO|nr:uncharacterized protein N7482_000244 [Penicillium canariense]KAJ5174367.1 hypothetical protein N7482_000244 [Penicillium canariense]